MKIQKKTILKTVAVEKDEYVAADGKTFDDEDECRAYENTMMNAQNVVLGIETCPALDDVSPLDGGVYLDDSRFKWYRPKSSAEIRALCAVYHEQIPDDCINHWICIEWLNGDASSCAYYKLSNSIEHIQNFFQKLGITAVFTQNGQPLLINNEKTTPNT